MKIYIAGPYTRGDTAEHVKNALDVADRLSELGFIPFIPHLYHFWHIVSPKSYEFWMKLDMTWLESCDALYRIEGNSPGADREVERALELGKPVVYSIAGINKLKISKRTIS